MSLLERIDSPDGEAPIEPGKRVIKAGDDRGPSLAARLSNIVYRFALRTPWHRLRLRGRFPLKLLAVPKDPIAGHRAAGEALLAGTMIHGHHRVAVAALDFTDPHLPTAFRDYLHSFAWLRDLAAAAPRERASPLAEALVGQWLAAHANSLADHAWRADLWGRRIFFWAAYAPYILSSQDLVYRSSVLNALARGARHLDRGANKAPAGLPRIAAWSGVVAAALLVQGGPSRLARGETGLQRALDEAMHDDGGLVSRSPAEQVGLVELLGPLRAAYYAAREDMPEALLEALAGAVEALLAVTLGDGALSSWQGGHSLSKRRVEAAVEGAAVRARAAAYPQGWGYQRLAARNTLVVFDAAPPPATRALRGGCASTLAFELSDGSDRLIVNCGGPGDIAEAWSPALTEALRTTAAHSTLTLDDRNSTATHADGTLGKGVVQVETARADNEKGHEIEASHDGYVRRLGMLHQRRLLLSVDGRALTGEDRLVPRGRRRRPGPIPFAVRFHLAPHVEVTSTADGQGALLRIRGGAVWQFRCRGGRLGIEESVSIDGEARPHPSLQLVIAGETPVTGTSIGWELHRAG